MTREEIQAQLDALKNTKFDRLKDSALIDLENGRICSICGIHLHTNSAYSHEKTCIEKSQQIQQIKKLLSENKDITSPEIGKIMGLKDTRVRAICKEANIELSWGIKVREKNQLLVDKIQSIIDCNPNILNKDIANMIGESETTVAKLLSKIGTESIIKKTKKERDAKIIELYKEGNSVADIKRILNWDNQPSIRKTVIKAGLYVDPSTRRKNTEKKIMELYKQGKNYTEIGSIVNLHAVSVSSYVKKVLGKN